MDKMFLIPAVDLETVKEKYIDVIEKTPGMEHTARWVYGKHPDDKLLSDYINNGEMYLLMDDDKVAGMVAIVMHQEPDYEPVSWEEKLANDEVATLRLLTVCMEYRGRSLGNRILEEAIRISEENGKKALRLDTLKSNLPAQHMYDRAGFSFRGEQRLYEESLGWADFYYYEKTLDNDNG